MPVPLAGGGKYCMRRATSKTVMSSYPCMPCAARFTQEHSQVAEDVTLPSEVTDAEKAALQTLKGLLTDDIVEYPNSDSMPDVFGDLRLLMFLKAAKGDAEQAAKQFKDFLAWRVERNVDSIRADIIERKLSFDDIPNLKKVSYYLPLNACLRNAAGEPLRAKDGSFIYCERLGMIESNGFVGEVTDDEFSEMSIYLSELGQLVIHNHYQRTGELASFMLAIDVGGAPKSAWSNPKVCKTIVNRLGSGGRLRETYYPQQVSKVCFLNAPWLFDAFFKLLKPFFPKDSLSKVNIFRPAENGILQLVDEKNLPEFLGGSCDSPLGQVPETGRLLNDRFGLGSTGVETVTIAKGQSMQIPLTVKKGDIVSWAFGVESQDINFGVEVRSQRDGQITSEFVVPLGKCSSHRSVRGEYSVEDTEARLVLIFDNTGSWVRSKTVHYRYDITSADEAAELDAEVSAVQPSYCV
ncbi:monooxygenase [Perkinsus chesapeaki]|uniref:Monooxygenase n=1 Tax=Perkinsus chesapeaki TaxID=330153 RepID=A0A7J6MK06_PERCH|nr:monooxygenase [Perkinsus chesapeaki]